MNKPKHPSEFVGKTGLIAKVLFHKLPTLKQEDDPLERCYLFTGPPGTAKSTLAEALAAVASGNPIKQVWRGCAPCVEQINGQSCTVDTVRKWQEDGWYCPLFGDMWVKIIDEINASSLAACNQLRTYLDKLPPRTLIIATTNLPVSELQEQLQSRFKVQYFEKVSTADVASWLVQNHQIPLPVAQQIAAKTNGNVRAARADALGYLEAMAVAA